MAIEEKVIKSNSIGSIFKHISARLTHKTGIAPLKNSQNLLIVDNSEKAKLLNSHFVSVGTADDGNLPIIDISNCSTNKIESIYFDHKDVLKVMSKLKTSSAAGPDGFAPIVFKSLKFQLAYPLTILFL